MKTSSTAHKSCAPTKFRWKHRHRYSTTKTRTHFASKRASSMKPPCLRVQNGAHIEADNKNAMVMRDVTFCIDRGGTFTDVYCEYSESGTKKKMAFWLGFERGFGRSWDGVVVIRRVISVLVTLLKRPTRMRMKRPTDPNQEKNPTTTETFANSTFFSART